MTGNTPDQSAAELVPGHFVVRPRLPVPPLVLASPHSGRAFPAGFLGKVALPLADLRRAEDPFVDELLAPCIETHGLPLVSARWGRAFVDLNRDPRELDGSLLLGDLAGIDITRTDRVRSGLGVLPRVTGPGYVIYRDQIAVADALQRLRSVHRPYHDRIARLVADARAANGYAVLVDCHSMPPLPLRARERPDIVIGDAGGMSAPEPLVRALEAAFRRAGLRTARNAPYSGGYTTRHHAAVASGVYCVQIEIDRALYIDPETLVRRPGFDQLARLLAGVLGELVDWRPLRPALAAE